ncbi:isochorismatase [Cryptococcus gattii Ru294]|uniref:Isochorismatase family hydrolase, putative n=2 Tax=Cryptococcus gattii TaxID=37769 RepID=E6RE28_CRYGW|nr:Isochorismatase family hydrolase, putative [Cryptococcus gattii WM276]KIR51140.1 isochorismatase [Cryptococcus gattii Ru294]KIR78980.1 isochorismatase [Cryptococcus gattii EJB2]KIY30873.1 isochorismatase [Cryptococcus gattii E566]KJE01754.1 isochorismatase [Cryptococcus gattii NT-10]ADV25060.1 Isochorismatase family hydrolase, putative [Cryptococcus gattii WM276]
MPKTFRQHIGIAPSAASTVDSVLVIIDAQNEYADGLLKTAEIDSTRKNIKTLLDRYRKTSAPVIHVVHEVPAGAPLFTPGTPLADELEELRPVSDESVVVKHHPGSFTDTNLNNLIEKTGRKKLVLVGYMAHVCVSTTARQAAEKGYDVILPREAIGDRDIPGAEASVLVDIVLSELADAFGTVVSVSDIN